MIEPEIYRSIEEVDVDAWDSLLDGERLMLSSSYLRLAERTLPGTFDWHYLICRNDDGSIAAHASFYETRLPLDVLAARSHPLARGLAACRRLSPRVGALRVVASGPPAALGHALAFRPGLTAERRAEVVRHLLDQMRTLATRRGIRFLAVRDLRAENEDDLLRTVLEEEGLVEIPNLDDTRINVEWCSLEEYLAALRGRYRKLLRRQERVARDAGLRLERTAQWHDLAEEMAQLFAATAGRHTAVPSPRADYFAGLSRLGGEAVGATLFWLDSRLVAFILFSRSRTTLTPIYLGADYEINRRVPLVFLAFYDMVRLAIEEQVSYIRFGRTSYRAKMRLGAIRVPMSLYASFGGPAANALAERLTHRISPKAEGEQWRAFRDTR